MRVGAHRLPGRAGSLSLRARLVTLLIIMLAAGSLVVGGVTHSAMATHLWTQLDSSLEAVAERATSGNHQRLSPEDITGQPSGTLAALISGSTFVADPEVSEAQMGQPIKLTQQDQKRMAQAVKAAQKDQNSGTTVALSAGDYRLHIQPVISESLPKNTVLVVGLPTEPTYDTLNALDMTMLLVSIVGLLIIGTVGAIVVRATLRPLAHVVDVADAVTQQPLGQGDVDMGPRVNRNVAANSTEAGRVGGALNRLLDHVHSALSERAASEQKMRRFVGDASHELRTPLAAIRGYTEYIGVTESLSDMGQQSLDRVLGQTKNMHELVEQLLLLARLEESKPQDTQLVDMVQLAANAYLDGQAAFPDHEWQFEAFNADVPAVVTGVESQLNRVLVNLTSNAAKHTSAGTTITVTVHIEPAAESSSSAPGDQDVVVRVQDTGEGIDPAFLPEVFDRFARADQARSGSASTTGLGLSIVKAITESHGGTVAVTSVPGDTEFTLRLPLGQATSFDEA